MMTKTLELIALATVLGVYFLMIKFIVSPPKFKRRKPYKFCPYHSMFRKGVWVLVTPDKCEDCNKGHKPPPPKDAA